MNGSSLRRYRTRPSGEWTASAWACVDWRPATTANAQVLGTFTWQTQPYCNVLSLTVIQLGTLFQVVGTDNLCGTGTAAVNGSAVLSGSNVAFGLTVAHATGPASHISATISLGTISGTWTDSDGRTGAFAFNPAAPAGSARPLPTAFVPLANTLSALVSSTGTLIRGVGAVSAARAGGATGQYQVVFNRNVPGGQPLLRAGDVSLTVSRPESTCPPARRRAGVHTATDRRA